jgi:N-acylneuraminate cytidylyltransferase
MKSLAFIPARGGSKGLPNKNIKNLLGKPLINYSIESAKTSNRIDHIVVSTDCDEIAEITRESGVEILCRPEAVSNDQSKTIDTLNFHYEFLKDYDIIVILQPTSPLRPKDLIDECINEFLIGEYSNLVTGYYCKFQEFGSHNNMRRQDVKGFFYDDGSLYILTPSLIKKNQWFGDNIKKIVNKRQFTFEIDDEIDFLILEKLIKNYG